MKRTPLEQIMLFCVFLGLASLTLTHEISAAHAVLPWLSWLVALRTSSNASWKSVFKRGESAAIFGVLFFLGFDLFFFRENILIAIAHFLLNFMVIKLVCPWRRRDCAQIVLVSFFQMLSASTLSVDFYHAAIYFALIPATTTALFWLFVTPDSTDPFSDDQVRSYRKLSRWIALAAFPVNLFFAASIFVFFPRLTMNFGTAALETGRTGYTEGVTLSQSGTIQNDDTSVLWLKINPPERRSEWNGYLRGTTLDYFDGTHWKPDPSRRSRLLSSMRETRIVFMPRVPGATQLHQTVTMVHGAKDTVFGAPWVARLEVPLATVQYFEDGSLRWYRMGRKPERYDVISVDRTQMAIPVDADFLQLPPMDFRKTLDLAKTVAKGDSVYEQVKSIENHVQRRCQYSLEMGEAGDPNPVETFLFKNRKGPCGSFASSMAVMLRLLGIRARLVAGYQTGEWNDLAQQYLIREKDAHTWVEVYIPDTGWQLFDPTPKGNGAFVGRQLWNSVRQRWDYINYRWTEWVIEYDLSSQEKLFSSAQSKSNQWQKWFRDAWRSNSKESNDRSKKPFQSSGFPWGWAFAAMGVAAGYGALRQFSSLFKSNASAEDLALRRYRTFLNRMSRRGRPKNEWETGWEYLQRIGDQAPDGRAITDAYYRSRFSAKP